MAINKVEFGDVTLIDLTNDSVTPSDVKEGVVFHDASGESRVGEYTPLNYDEIAETVLSQIPRAESEEF